MLQNIGLPGLLLIAVVVLVLFGRGKVSSLMGEVGKGITAFKKGVKEGGEEIERETEQKNSAEVRPISNTPSQDAVDARTRADEALRDVTPRDGDRS
ncbi:twin-arginine translocase TatA/TatE family subunit [Paracoccus sp. MBLB3053]|uniref:Sec-independent protein translocase protein TatA n=1 Tax=Paracoccus aurantius TaxID=3073814 RepID=A0ABU2HRT9_9RHOB|nr:twin-arginine translocase TatA/TatE family subunit [Paracoccus sp. MBLB3053]MDS9467766.1 twin-arginine translocase TatA/TatE family subunit [Paracoccus sp. MBLB3053]